jgi:hypothetical protein
VAEHDMSIPAEPARELEPWREMSGLGAYRALVVEVEITVLVAEANAREGINDEASPIRAA